MKLQAFLPLITYPDANSDGIASNATALAAFLGADLHAGVFNVDIPNISNALSKFVLKLPDLIRETEAQSRARGEHLVALVQTEAAERAVHLTTSLSTAAPAFLGEAATMEARYFDLAILGWDAGDEMSRSAAEAVAFGSGRPTVLLPSSATFGPAEHVAIAWDGSRVAARAVADAAPFLQRAGRTTVFTVVDEKPLDDKSIAERLATSLGKRGIAADAISIRAEDSPIGISLQEHALKHGADLLVMGAYGHSAVRDFILGGATEDILDDLRLPILCSH
jgi:nucleotide-binding universal stress UspA family protein